MATPSAAWSGRTAIMPSVGQGIVTACLVLLALGVRTLPLDVMPWLFLVLSMAIGTTMPVVNITVQVVAGGSPEVAVLRAMQPYVALRGQAAPAGDAALHRLQQLVREQAGSYQAGYSGQQYFFRLSAHGSLA